MGTMKVLVFLVIIFLVLSVILPGIGNKIQIRSSSLQVTTTSDDNVQRIDYVDSDGRITFAADKHYASIIKTKIENKIYEEYLDSEGQPAKQVIGHYSVCREYDSLGNNYKVIFLDINGKPMMTNNGYAIILRTFYESGKIKTEEYYDTEGTKTDSGYYGYGNCREYDSMGRIITLKYLGIDGKPITTRLGYAIAKRNYSNQFGGENTAYDEYYYNENEEAAILIHGQSGIHREFDELGRESLITYLGTNEMPIAAIEGYATIKKTYNEDDSVKTEMYFDLNDNPIRLSEGQYGILYRDGKKIYLDRNGNELFNLRLSIYNNELLTVLFCVSIVLTSAFVDKKINAILLVVYLIAILYMTLLFRSKVTIASYRFFGRYGEFLSDRGVREEIVNNIVLFVPFGSILYCIYPKRTGFIISIMLSIIIEAIQYFTGTGFCELDDIISNGLGGIIGVEIARFLQSMKKKYYYPRNIS